MDLVAEYAHAYGGAPRPDQPWPEVLALFDRVGRFAARKTLEVTDGVSLGQRPQDDSEVGRRQIIISGLARRASPARPTPRRTEGA